MRQSHAAYLILTVRPSAVRDRCPVVDVGIYSEPYPTTYFPCLQFPVCSVTGVSFDSACRKLNKMIRRRGTVYKWLVPYIRF